MPKPENTKVEEKKLEFSFAQKCDHIAEYIVELTKKNHAMLHREKLVTGMLNYLNNSDPDANDVPNDHLGYDSLKAEDAILKQINAFKKTGDLVNMLDTQSELTQQEVDAFAQVIQETSRLKLKDKLQIMFQPKKYKEKISLSIRARLNKSKSSNSFSSFASNYVKPPAKSNGL